MPRESVNVRELKRKAVASLRTTITAFNALDDDGRVTTVLLHLQHSFEMLLKAALDKNKVPVFDKRSERSITFEFSVRKAQETEGIKLTDEEAGTLRVIDAWRDAAQHWYLVLDEALLYLHVRAAVTLFEELLSRVFSEPMADHVPARVLPISAEPPQDVQLLVDREYERVAQLLGPNKRGRGEAQARIRALLAMEAHNDADAGEVRQADVRRVEKAVRQGSPREQTFPKLATVASDISGEGLTVQVKLVKSGGLPMTYVSDSASSNAAGIRLVDLEKKFYMGAFDLADRAGITRNKAVALRRHLDLDANDDVHSHRFVHGSQKLMRYSDNALRKMKTALEHYDIEQIWSAHRTARKGQVTPSCTQPGCAERNEESPSK